MCLENVGFGFLWRINKEEEMAWTLSLFLEQTPKNSEAPSSLVDGEWRTFFVKTDFSHLFSVIVSLHIYLQSPLPTWQWINSRFTQALTHKWGKKDPEPPPQASSWAGHLSWAPCSALLLEPESSRFLLQANRNGSLEGICNQNAHLDLNTLKK